MSTQNDVVGRLQADIEAVQRAADDAARRLRSDADKQEAAERKNSDGKLAKEHQHLMDIRAEYADVLAEHRSAEQALRKVTSHHASRARLMKKAHMRSG